MSTTKPQILKGFRDSLPDQMRLRQRVLDRIREVFERHGFEPIDTPALEYLAVLTGKAGENEKLMYHFVDHGDRSVGLRYDLTVPLARFIAMHQNDIVMPFKRYHIAPVWRAEKPQRGRFREFWQCDADIVGSSSMLADAETVSVLSDCLAAVNLGSAVVAINHRKLLAAMAILAGVPAEGAPTVFRAIDKLARIGMDNVRSELVRAGVEGAAADRVLELVSADGASTELLDNAACLLADIPEGLAAVEELRQLIVDIDQLGVPSDSYRIDLSMARGIDYYTGPVFEAIIEDAGVGSVAGAGRYDGLIGHFLGREVPATGMSLGIERILEIVRDGNLLDVASAVADVFIASAPGSISKVSSVARDLRAAGLNVDQSIVTNRSIGDQLKNASRRSIPLAIIIGEAELANNTAQIKDLVDGQQREVPLANLVTEVTIDKRTGSRASALNRG